MIIEQIENFSGKLSILDKDLEQFAKKHSTQVSSPKVNYYPPNEDSLENRQINWSDGPIAKAILIQPHQTPSDVKSNMWDFIILAWIKDAPSVEKPFIKFLLLNNVGIDSLKRNIKELLSKSEQMLDSLKLDDIK